MKLIFEEKEKKKKNIFILQQFVECISKCHEFSESIDIQFNIVGFFLSLIFVFLF